MTAVDGRCELFVALLPISRILVHLHHCSRTVQPVMVSCRIVSALCTSADIDALVWPSTVCIAKKYTLPSIFTEIILRLILKNNEYRRFNVRPVRDMSPTVL